MKITTLIKKLEKLKTKNPKLEVIVSSDQEGNWFNLLGNVTSQYKYDAENHEIYDTSSNSDDEYIPEDAVDVIILWPV